jgi:hypothetical protein
VSIKKGSLKGDLKMWLHVKVKILNLDLKVIFVVCNVVKVKRKS